MVVCRMRRSFREEGKARPVTVSMSQPPCVSRRASRQSSRRSPPSGGRRACVPGRCGSSRLSTAP